MRVASILDAVATAKISTFIAFETHDSTELMISQLLSAVEHLHDKNICLRDLKPENILYCSQDDANPVIKAIELY